MGADAGTDETGHRAGRSGCSIPPGNPDAGQLARDWITLWQSEISAMAADPEIREFWQAIMAIWAGTLTALLRDLPLQRHDRPHKHSGGHDDGPASGQAGSTDAARSASAPAASDPRDAEIERLARHVSALERRLAEIERRGNHPGDPERRPRRRPKP